ncbi:hypothetical protein GCM10020000_76240 [Streptomyces olivoverticillatus]
MASTRFIHASAAARGVGFGTEVDAVQCPVQLGCGDDGLPDLAVGAGVESEPQGLGGRHGGAYRGFQAAGVEGAAQLDVLAGVVDRAANLPGLCEPDRELGLCECQGRFVSDSHLSPPLVLAVRVRRPGGRRRARTGCGQGPRDSQACSPAALT